MGSRAGRNVLSFRPREWPWTRAAEFGPLALWLLVYPALLCLGHAALRTNAYDLSVFDYALWSSLAGRPGHVPFLAQSLFSHHVMPTLLALLPLHAVWPSPWLLILVQIAAVPAAWLMARAVFRSLALPAAASSALLFAFLFSRRTHSAVTATFYIECLEPVLVLWMIWAWLRGRPRQYWVALLLALGCKEDMALYVAAFGLVLIAQKAHRRLGLATAAVGTLWLALSIWVIVPAVRQAEGLPPTYPFLEDRYHADGQTGTSVGEALGRMASARSLGRVFNLTSTVGFLCIGGPEWSVVLLPGVAANLAARPDTLQSVFVSHYVWPVLPWLFMAGAAGLTRLWRVAPRAGLAASALLALLTIADSPLWITRVPDRAELATARTIRQSLSRIPDDAGVWVAPNLLPHLAQRRVAHTIGSRIDPAQVQILALANFGNLWPLDRDQVDRIARACEQDPHVSKQPAAGPLLVFHLHADAFADPNGCVAAARGTAPD